MKYFRTSLYTSSSLKLRRRKIAPECLASGPKPAKFMLMPAKMSGCGRKPASYSARVNTNPSRCDLCDHRKTIGCVRDSALSSCKASVLTSNSGSKLRVYMNRASAATQPR